MKKLSRTPGIELVFVEPKTNTYRTNQSLYALTGA